MTVTLIAQWSSWISSYVEVGVAAGGSFVWIVETLLAAKDRHSDTEGLVAYSDFVLKEHVFFHFGR